MNLQNWTKKVVILYIFGITQVIILSICAMLSYAGGTKIDPFAEGYTFWMNYISDLGRTIAYSGLPNTVSQSFFTIMEGIWSVTFMALFIVLASLLAESSKKKWLSIGGGILTIISGIALICAVFAPENLYSDLHMDFAIAYYLTNALTTILFALAIVLEQRFSKKHAIPFFILVIISIIYGVIAIIGFNLPLTSDLLIIYVVGQKVITYTLLIGTCTISYGMWKLSNRKG